MHEQATKKLDTINKALTVSEMHFPLLDSNNPCFYAALFNATDIFLLKGSQEFRIDSIVVVVEFFQPYFPYQIPA